jgi:hypothetical protein
VPKVCPMFQLWSGSKCDVLGTISYRDIVYGSAPQPLKNLTRFILLILGLQSLGATGAATLKIMRRITVG